MTYFSLKQCIYSSTLDENSNYYCGDEEAEKIGGNVPGDDYTSDRPDFEKDVIITNINNLMNKCVNPIKNRFPDVVLSSVYRNKKLNEFIGGNPESQHLYGYAVDLVSINTFETHEIFNWVIDQGIDFDQMIWEFPEKGRGVDGSWIHISYKSNNNLKKTTLSSKSSELHEKYKGTLIGEHQHDIKRAYPEYLIEKSENAQPPISKHPNAVLVEPNRGYYHKKIGPFNQITVKDDDMNILYKGDKSSGSVEELIAEAKIALTIY
jgi:zinc D-Ala-D-Ala carboxypeptidase